MFASLAQMFKPNTNMANLGQSTATGSASSSDKPPQIPGNLFAAYQKPSLNQILGTQKHDSFLNFSQPYRLNEKRNYRMLLNQHLRQKTFSDRPALDLIAGSTAAFSNANYRPFPYASSTSLFNVPGTNRIASIVEKLRALQENEPQTTSTQTIDAVLFSAISGFGSADTRIRTPTRSATPAKTPSEEMEIDENYFGSISKGTSIVSISETWENLELDSDVPESVRKYKELSANYEKYKQQTDVNPEQMYKLVQQLKKDEAKLRECRDRCRQNLEDLGQLNKDRKAQNVSIAKLRYCSPCFEIQSLDDDDDSYQIFGSDEEDDLWDEVGTTDKDEADEIELPDVVLERVQKVLEIRDMTAKITDKYNSDIRRKDLETLQGLNWLNDEVINFYFNMISERSQGKVHCFNTFFLTKLRDGGHKALRRWTKKVDIFSFDLVLIPVHLGLHWTLASIDFAYKQINYYDSMSGNNNECLNLLLEYLHEESMDKRKTPFDSSGWQLNNVKGIPQQGNGSDCGMFTCKYGDYLSRGKKFTFTQVSRSGFYLMPHSTNLFLIPFPSSKLMQSSMPFFRTRLIYEIITGQLLN
jgi:hypothetical protein